MGFQFFFWACTLHVHTYDIDHLRNKTSGTNAMQLVNELDVLKRDEWKERRKDHMDGREGTGEKGDQTWLE